MNMYILKNKYSHITEYFPPITFVDESVRRISREVAWLKIIEVFFIDSLNNNKFKKESWCLDIFDNYYKLLK